MNEYAPLLALNEADLNKIFETLTQQRLSRYLEKSNHDRQRALQLYVLNAKVSAAFLTDLHYVEVALRNKFDQQLTAAFGAEWFKEADFLGMLDPHSRAALEKVLNSLRKNESSPPGKVIAELSFGFWQKLTDPKHEHALWVPCLHKAFLPRKAPKRATFNQQLEKLRKLRNRIAHHEPIFHLDLMGDHQLILEVSALLCPVTAAVIHQTSTVGMVVSNDCLMIDFGSGDCRLHGRRVRDE